MYANSNQEIIYDIAKEDYKAHKMRSRVAILAIALTALLITVVCTSGIGTVRATNQAWGASPGPGADSAAIIGTEAQYEAVQKLPQVEWAAIARNCSTSVLHNEEMLGLTTKLLAVEADYCEKNNAELIAGRFPEKADEVLLSDTLRDRLQLSGEPGEALRLNVVVLREGQEVVEPIDMTVTGYYYNPLRNITDYEELYTTRAFLEEYNPEMLNDSYTIYVKLNNLEPLKLKNDLVEKLTEVQEAVGAESITYKMVGMDLTGILPFLIFLLLIMVSGYFLIYNVFQISVINEIRFFGVLKTIGTTGKQLKKILKYQMRRQAFFGILFGIAAGFFIGIWITPVILNSMDAVYLDFYEAPNVLFVAAAAALFSYLTVAVSVRKPFRIASVISPIEASRYMGKKKHAALSVISFVLSGVIFLVASNATLGYQVEKIADRFVMRDIKVTQRNAEQPSREKYQPMNRELAEDIAKLPFVEQTDLFYQARTGISDGFYSESAAEVRVSGSIEADIRESLGERYQEFLNERGNLALRVLGMDPALLLEEGAYRAVLDGELDAEKFASGDYILYQNVYGFYSTGIPENQVKAGDRVTLSFYQDAADSYVEKEVTVLAVLGNDGAPIYGKSHLPSQSIIMPVKLFGEIYEDMDSMISEIQITTKAGDAKEQRDLVEQRMLEEYNFQLTLDSRWDQEQIAAGNKASMTMMGLFLSGIFGMIGIINVVNTLVTDILARKLEFAGMQSVGMTRKQLMWMLLLESGRLCGISVLFMLPIGAWLAEKVAENSLFTGFSLPVFGICALLVLLISLGTAAGVAVVMTRVLNRKSIVERLREAE